MVFSNFNFYDEERGEKMFRDKIFFCVQRKYLRWMHEKPSVQCRIFMENDDILNMFFSVLHHTE
jgi:hypothetical protein